MPLEITDNGKRNKVEISKKVVQTGALRIVIEGNDNHLVIGAGARLGNGLIEIRNNTSSIHIGAKTVINGQLRCRADNTHIRIGEACTFMQVIISLHEAGRITMGRDCMLSGDIQMDVSDMHSILDVQTGARINPPEDITIGDHVWLAQGVRLLKGARIGDNCVIGSRALVTGAIPAGCVAVGQPAKVVREGVTWDRQRVPWND